MKYLLTISLILIGLSISAQETITLTAGDGLEITADTYIKHPKDAPFIILFHQAGCSRGEYLEIAPKLNELGYNCLAIDQRSGNKVNDVENLTSKKAKEAKKDTKFVDAFQDIEAAVNYVQQTFPTTKIIIWGSSYSSSLVLKYAGDNPDNIQGVLAFSPGEYFKSKDFIQSSAATIKCPSFITSAKGEKGRWWEIHQAIPTKTKAFYLPSTAGNHGSRALWEKFSDNEGYWEAVKDFLAGI